MKLDFSASAYDGPDLVAWYRKTKRDKLPEGVYKGEDQFVKKIKTGKSRKKSSGPSS